MMRICISIVGFIALLLAACTGGTPPTDTPPTEPPTLVPTATNLPTLQPSITPEPSIVPTETFIPVTVESLLGEEIPPPINISVPEGWLSGTDALLLADLDGRLRSIPVAIYTGPVTGGTGYIVLFWGFPNLAPIGAENSDMDYLMWTEGLRLFRMAVVEDDCNPGTDLQNTFPVGDRMGSGTRFAIVDCPTTPDASGWFTALQVQGGNFAFYNFIEPAGDINSPQVIDEMAIGYTDLQAILNTVQFNIPEAPAEVPTEAPAETPAEAPAEAPTP